MTSNAQQVGKLGEELAVRFLKGRGYTILCRNYNIQGIAEIDIIAQNEGVLHFFEVKTSEKYCIGDEMHASRGVTREKILRMQFAIRKYSNEYAITLPRSISLLFLSISRETCYAKVYMEENIYSETI